MKRYPPINDKFPHFLHGGDYNPDQWRDTPEIWDEDMRLMKLANCNAMSVGIFSWQSLEPEEGVFTFDWLDTIMDKLADNGGYAVLATPSGSKPAWMSHQYPEVCRVRENGIREHHVGRHNHCRTSPVYRDKCRIINTKLAERYKDHPALLVWHVSNEYNAEPCYCDHCLTAFRQWLKKKYDNDLDRLNFQWWAGFWSHRFTNWDQIRPDDDSIHGMMLDWRRFSSDQTIDFYNAEAAPLRAITPDKPVTTNFMGFYEGIDYRKFAQHLDVVSWDNYPNFADREDTWKFASVIAFKHDMMRGYKDGRPFMLMECTPSNTNWREVSKLKRPGVHRLECLQGVAHGADTVQYFQWRKSRGGGEKFHGAVVDHVGHENTRVFRDVSDLGATLTKLDPVIGTSVQPEVAVLFDWENHWAIEMEAGPRNAGKNYRERCEAHYRPYWMNGVPVDIAFLDSDFSQYKLLIAPMLYMISEETGKSIEAFVRSGGTLVCTYMTGMVNENDLCWLGGFPGPLKDVLGIWSEELDVLLDDESAIVKPLKGNALDLSGEYTAAQYCDLFHLEGAEALAEYGSQFYAGRPAVSVNTYWEGKAYYIGSRNDDRFLKDFHEALIRQLGIRRVLNTDLPEGVTAQMRQGEHQRYVFLMNWTKKEQTVYLGNAAFLNIETGEGDIDQVKLKPYETVIMES